MAHIKLVAALETSDKWQIADASLLHWRKKLKRAAQACNDTLHECKRRTVEEEQIALEARNYNIGWRRRMLMEELVEEVLLRIPPCDPASLVRAALVCKEWCRIVAGPGFRRRFRELHRTPPTLGVLCHSANEGHQCISGFVPISSCLPQADHYDCCTVDARHGRVLFLNLSLEFYLSVWDPVTGELWELPVLQLFNLSSWSAAALCAAHSACGHLDCNGGPFLVVVVRSFSGKMRVNVYSSETGSWSEETCGAQSPTDLAPLPAAALVGSALYFLTDASKSILKYELTTRNMSVIQPRPDCNVDCAVLTTLEDGGLGVAGLKDSSLYLWSMETGPKGDAGWAQIGVVQLQTLLPVNVAVSYDSFAFAHGVEVFFVRTNEGLFSIDLMSHKAKKVCDASCGGGLVVPYMSFDTPALRMASTGDGPNRGASSA